MSPFITIALSLLLTQDLPGTTAPDAVLLAETIETIIPLEMAAHGPWDDLTEHEFEALLLETAHEESHFDMRAVGDHGAARCAMQVHAIPEVVARPGDCVQSAIERMRDSLRTAKLYGSPKDGLAQYCGGLTYRTEDGHIARNVKARELGRRRLKSARALAAKAEEILATNALTTFFTDIQPPETHPHD